MGRLPSVVIIHVLALAISCSLFSPAPHRGGNPGAAGDKPDYGAWTSPLPTRDAGKGSGREDDCKRRHKVLPRKAELLCAQSAAQPATCGVAMLVPLIVR